MKSKVFDNSAAALFDFRDGVSLMSGGFGLCGIPENSIKEIRQGLQTYGNGRDGVPVASFAGSHVFLLLERNKGHAGRSVWEVGPGDDKASAKLTALGRSPPGDRGDEMIHVFTVASGHMYERLQKIMILSAVKRSSRKIKFWFISNSISNQHREFIPIMAAQYGFEYEFITFKWPTWLHKQTDKQRIIWAYKILFLDVMFPLGLKKVIFCDSDQVIRADLAELWDLDLGGKPYGYVPMCGGNGEDDMDRFRFWKTGYWQEHLRGLPYHISALYVVDLQRFRAMAAGDHLLGRRAFEDQRLEGGTGGVERGCVAGGPGDDDDHVTDVGHGLIPRRCGLLRCQGPDPCRGSHPTQPILRAVHSRAARLPRGERAGHS